MSTSANFTQLTERQETETLITLEGAINQSLYAQEKKISEGPTIAGVAAVVLVAMALIGVTSVISYILVSLIFVAGTSQAFSKIKIPKIRAENIKSYIEQNFTLKMAGESENETIPDDFDWEGLYVSQINLTGAQSDIVQYNVCTEEYNIHSSDTSNLYTEVEQIIKILKQTKSIVLCKESDSKLDANKLHVPITTTLVLKDGIK